MTRRCHSGRKFIVVYDQIMVGWIKFLEKGTPPDSRMGRLFGGFLPVHGRNWETPTVACGRWGCQALRRTRGSVRSSCRCSGRWR